MPAKDDVTFFEQISVLASGLASPTLCGHIRGNEMRVYRIGLLLVSVLVWGCTSVTDTPPEQGADGSTTEVVGSDLGSDAGQDAGQDTTEADPGSADSGVEPTDSVVTPDEGTSSCEPGSGCFGELCESNGDCISQICLPHLGDTVCSQPCIEDCPQGWKCQSINIPGSDLSFACVSDFGMLCMPCHQNGDCTTDQIANVCADYGVEGAFCGASCEETQDCPEGFACQEIAAVQGTTSKQCVAESGTCECAQRAIDLALSTPCSTSNELGTCTGSRVCTDEGLSACDAPEPTAEICNGLDDNCDGSVDEATCDDGNPCTEDVCNGEAGCSHTPLEGAACSDENACTHGDICVDGSCQGTEIQCEDTNPCTDDLCDEVVGCDFAFNDAPCDDEDPCTVGDTCGEGVCVSGLAITCTDNNPCTDDSCDPAGGCIFTPNTASCDDGNLCTTVDTCSDGACHGTSPLDCVDESACTTDYCDPLTGCEHPANTLPCNDGNACTLGDVCADGACSPGSGSMNCDDGNPCTDDICDPEGACIHLPNDADCNDNNECTTADACQEGACVGAGPLMCDDGNPCTYDFCLAGGGCQHDNVVGPCSDGDNCTFDDFCSGGSCIGGAVKACDDGNPCTDDVCNSNADCEFLPNTNPCDDENACTNEDACSGGTCVGSGSPDCEDGDVCTTNSCDPAVGCSLEYNTNPCEDGNPCTVTDICAEGTCVGGGDVDCDDGDHCTADSCDPVLGCVSVPADSCCGNLILEEGEECDDGNLEGLDGCNALCQDELFVTFNYTGGEQTWTVPAGITQVVIEVWGAMGGGSLCSGGPPDDDGGLGGYSRGTLAVTPGETLYIYVGEKGNYGNPVSAGGWNGGGGGGHYGGGGGGGTDVRQGGNSCHDRVIVAGAGGGGNCGSPNHGAGGFGGGLDGGPGLSFAWASPSGGGSQTAGGSPGTDGTAGSFCAGGDHVGTYHFAGGGGGWYGGGSVYAAGAGGGSGYIGGVTLGETTGNVRTGHGEAKFSW